MEVTEKMTEFQLEKAATLKTIAIRAKKVGEMVDFYKKVMGFVLKSEENNLSIWGTREAGTQLLILEETRKAEDFHNEEKQMAYLSIKVPTEKELLNECLNKTTQLMKVSKLAHVKACSLLILKAINLRFFTMKQQQIRLLKSNQLCLKILSVRT